MARRFIDGGFIQPGGIGRRQGCGWPQNGPDLLRRVIARAGQRSASASPSISMAASQARRAGRVLPRTGAKASMTLPPATVQPFVSLMRR